MFDLVFRRADLSIVEIRLCVERIRLEAHEAVVGAQLVDVLVGIADVEVEITEVGIPGFREARREHRAAAFARVGHDVVPAGRYIVDRPSVRGRSDLRAAAFDDVVAVVDFRQYEVRSNYPVVTEDILGTKAVLPGAQDFEIGSDCVDADVGVEADELLQFVECGVRVRQARHGGIERVADGRPEERRQEARECARDAIARVAVRQDDQRCAAAEQARATANGETVGRGPVEAEARQYEVLAVQVLGVVEAVASGKCRVERHLVAVVVLVETQAELQRQVAVRRPLVLDVQAVDGQIEVGLGIPCNAGIGVTVKRKKQ